MSTSLAAITLVVRDYDEAIAFYTNCLNFKLVEDTPLPKGKRWVRVAPQIGGVSLLLAVAANSEQTARIGDQTGGRVFLFLQTDDFDRDFQRFHNAGVQFLEQPRAESYGRVVVFVDLYGNRWDLIESKSP